MNVQSLEGLTIEGDVEIEIDAGAGGVGPLFAYYFAKGQLEDDAVTG
jgi:acetyl-CoA decarbonylase/synthase complex subunit delta